MALLVSRSEEDVPGTGAAVSEVSSSEGEGSPEACQAKAVYGVCDVQHVWLCVMQCVVCVCEMQTACMVCVWYKAVCVMQYVWCV